ncbi:synaptobrevin protein [Cyclospora cayetanensis]|uniref:Synaptobrevin protein n=1 Tax=Cyclospora cayetanensis TaxID=88456 RepID=A0A1D3DAQ6_9EIME|nr:synaptobrevin protein [Cyclospora cayetanensis]
MMESGPLFVYAAVARGKCVIAEHIARNAPEDIPRAARQALLRLPPQRGRRSYVFQSHLFSFLVGDQNIFLCVSPQEASLDISNTFLTELRASLNQRLAMRPSSPPPNLQEEATQAILLQLEALERGEGGGVQLITRVEKELEAVTDLVKDNINSVLERNEQIECLVGKTSTLKEDTLVKNLSLKPLAILPPGIRNVQVFCAGYEHSNLLPNSAVTQDFTARSLLDR